MPGTRKEDLGIGVGYRPAWRDDFLSAPKPLVTWIEVITDNFLPAGDGTETRARQTLRGLRRDTAVALHGVGLNLASADALDERYLAALARLSREIEPWLVTDHLCWTGVNRENLFDLLPFPFTKEALAAITAKIGRVQDLLRRPVAVENITFYAHPAGDELGEEDFLNELCARTGCRLLLDVNNIYVNSVNFGLDPMAYVRRLKLSNVAEIHLAGHATRGDGILVDTHGEPVPDAVWSLYEEVIALAGPVPTMIERDQNIPAWREMERELDRLRRLRRGREALRDDARMANPLP